MGKTGNARPARRFWNWARNEDGSRTLYLDGAIAEENWLGDEITPKQFKEELQSGEGDVTIWLNSPGGDVFAAAQIYNMLMDYPGNVIVKIDGIAASAASVIAMAGGDVYMSPVSMMMIHNPATIAIGDTEEMEKAIAMLDEVKESIINAYELKTGLSRARISHMMDAESWMNAKKAVELGFADDILFMESEAPPAELDASAGMIFSRQAVTASLQTALSSFCRKRQKLACSVAAPFPTESDDSAGTPSFLNRPKGKAKGTQIESLQKRLDLLKP
jgi:ATP-dependent Clp protease protease subunit